ncbi:MAG: putative ATP-dependent carboligase, ATP-grasp superfamily [Chloroflexi bacterium]|nr:MAG: putative ATP-dependent carboligase, ATP-grasp superfamily [Chloroflexota bacterium]
MAEEPLLGYEARFVEEGMQVGAFDLVEPLPTLDKPHLLLGLRPWVDVGSVGTLVLGYLERRLGSQDIGQLRRPSSYYDMTRYRPTIYRPEGGRRVELPNTMIRSVHREDGQDLVLMHALEPHNEGEELVESIGKVMEVLGVQRFCMIGAMYGPAPHTRPLKASGSSTDEDLQAVLESLGVHSSAYEGPTSVMTLVHEEAAKLGIPALVMLMQLPSYAQLEEDATGQHAMISLLSEIYSLDLDTEPLKARGERQYRRLDEWAQRDPRLKEAIKKLESVYDSDSEESPEEQASAEDLPQLSPEVERFLSDVEGWTKDEEGSG